MGKLRVLDLTNEAVRKGIGTILGESDWEAWLDPNMRNPILLQSMLSPCPDDWLECAPA